MFSKIPTTDGGRAVHIAAFERAVKELANDLPAGVSDRQQDEMVAAIIELAAEGTTDVETLARHAVAKARQAEQKP